MLNESNNCTLPRGNSHVNASNNGVCTSNLGVSETRGCDGSGLEPESASQRLSAPKLQALPRIEVGPADAIHVGAGGKLIVPREDLNADLDDGDELDLAALQAKKIRRPDRREWFALNRDAELTTRLLVHKPNPDQIDNEYYYIAPSLRAPILEELKSVLVYPYYSFRTKSHALWIIHVTPDNSWFESLHTLLKRPPEFFACNALRVLSDQSNHRYRAKHKPLPSEVPAVTRPTEELLGEALGQDRFIASADHPIYRDLIEGEEIL